MRMLIAAALFWATAAVATPGSVDAAIRGVDASSNQPKPVARCVVPRGWTVVGQDAQAVVVDRLVGRWTPLSTTVDELWAYRYCLRSTGRFRVLVADVARNSGDVYLHRGLVLSGAYVAYETVYVTGFGRYDCRVRVMSHNLRTRKVKTVFDVDCYDYAPSQALQSTSAPPTFLHLGPLLVNSRGFAAWRMTGNPLGEPGQVYTALSHVSCPAVSLCVADDEPGNILTATQPTAGRSAWTSTKPSASPGPISCPTSQFCVIVGSGASLSSTNPTGGPGAWSTSPMPAPQDFSDLSCASPSLCVAVGGNTIATSADPARATITWAEIAHPNAQSLAGVSCPSVSLCVAVDNSGDILASTDPTGGVSAWKPVFIGTDTHFASVTCPSTSLCVAVANTDEDKFEIMTSTAPAIGNPTAGTSSWKGFLLSTSARPTHVSCTPGPLCVAAGLYGIATSTNPAGGATAWKTQGLSWPDSALTSVSCASSSLCAVTTSTGEIGTSTNPAGKVASWSFQLIDLPACLPCVTQQLWAYDSHGTRMLDSAPTPGSDHALDNLALTGNLLTWTHNGTPRRSQLG